MKVMVIGSGGREHAIVWALQHDPRVRELYCAPGNDGMKRTGKVELVNINAEDIGSLVKFAEEEQIDITVPGPEAPLVAGIVDKFRAKGLNIFGPTAEAAQLEGSKVYAKEFMKLYSIPTAEFKVCNTPDEAVDYVKHISEPLVVKADGLAAGKGAIVCDTLEQQITAIEKIMVKKDFGDAGNKIVIEDKLEGQEVSYIVVTDGKDFVCMPTAMDYKPVYATLEDKKRFEGITGMKFDKVIGENTGGMGSISPSPHVDSRMGNVIDNQIVIPTLKYMAEEGNRYEGVLYVGLMLTGEGPKVLEYNCRFGDPEMQPQVMRLQDGDLLNMIRASIEGKVNKLEILPKIGYSVCVVAASKGYPFSKEKGIRIFYPPLEGIENRTIFFAGVKEKDGGLHTEGGRVLAPCVFARTLEEATAHAYKVMGQTVFGNMFYRKDIGMMP